MKRQLRILFTLILWLSVSLVSMADSKLVVPESLQDWQEWALYGDKERQCPSLYSARSATYCAWPGILFLNTTDAGLDFTQAWQVEQASWVPLVGSKKNWPLNVTADEIKLPVVLHKGRPSVYLDKGTHILKGKLAWQTQPRSITIPKQVGLVKAKNQSNKSLRFDGQRVWLKEQSGRQSKENNTTSVRVYRLLTDDVPLKQTTQLEIDVSGKSREITIGPIFSEQQLPVSLQSRLPVKLDKKGVLVIQAVPGKWRISVSSRFVTNQTEFTLPQSQQGMPRTELWSFKANPGLRSVTLTGKSVDPSQSDMPKLWKQYPAYQISEQFPLTIKELQQGVGSKTQNRLSLDRTVWLDFDGKGATYQDSITGTMATGWRITSDQKLQFGRAIIAGNNQLITDYQDRQGVELRGKQVALKTNLRQDTIGHTLAANGYNQTFDNVSMRLNIPPGWKLLHASGVDSVQSTWLSRWNLLDCFLVLVLTAAVYKLRGAGLSLLAFTTFIFIYQENNAPVLVWLLVLAAITLATLVKEHHQTWVNGFKLFSFVCLVVLSLPFLAQEFRLMLYPQLERTNEYRYGHQKASPSMEDVVFDEPSMMSARSLNSEMAPRNQQQKSKPIMKQQSERIDNAQTGPGIPSWDWKSARFNWTGQVMAGQEIKLYLLHPVLGRLHHLLNALMLIVLAGLLFGVKVAKTPQKLLPRLTYLLVMGTLVPMLGFSSDSFAKSYPDSAMLTELKQRLLKPASCFPNCADVSMLQVLNDGNALQLNLTVHVQERSAVFIPGDLKTWMPETVQVNGVAENALLRWVNGKLALLLDKGVHQVQLKGALDSDEVNIALPMPVYVVKNKSAWTLVGLKNERLTGSALHIKRQNTVATTHKKQVTEIPPFAVVTRTLSFNRTWQVTTTVTRVAPRVGAIQFHVPMLANESLLTEGIDVSNKQVLVTLNANQRTFWWQSNLNYQDELTLESKESPFYVETWRINVSTLWHPEFSKLFPSQLYSNGQWKPYWQPWPGEKLVLKLSALKPSLGKILTIQNSALTVNAGQRSQQVTLDLSLLSSTGTHYQIDLPDKASVTNLKVNGMEMPIQQSGNTLTVPINPGPQTVYVTWQAPDKIASIVTTPKVDLNEENTNAKLSLVLPGNRWILALGGPELGPAVLYWGVLVVITLAAYALGRLEITPLKFRHWFLLGLGLSMLSAVPMVIVVAWFFMVAYRTHLPSTLSIELFRLYQVILVIATVIMLAILIKAISLGLLGAPEMRITGYGSEINPLSSSYLHWYQDKSRGLLPTSWVFTLPLWTYRLFMLCWSLWLAFALVNWMQWGWRCFTHEGAWREEETKVKMRKE